VAEKDDEADRQQAEESEELAGEAAPARDADDEAQAPPEDGADDDADEDEADEDEADEDEADEDEADEDEADDAGEDEADDADEDEADDADEDEADDADEDEREAEGDRSEGRAASVAKALGVGEGDETEEAADDRPLNRAERRRQRALRRRQGRAAEEPEEETARDRNLKKRAQLLSRRRRAAEAEDEAPPDRLLPSEMVDDALARATAAVVKRLRHNANIIGWTLLVVLLGGGAFLYYRHRSQLGDAEVSDALAHAVQAEQALVLPKEMDQRTEEQKKADFRRIFASDEERNQAALEGYRKVAGEHGDSGAAILAKLGEAGVLLEEQKWDESIAAYGQVLESALASADPDVRARALEGRAFAYEANKQLDEAKGAFEKLGEVPGDGYKALSRYHLARVQLAQGNKAEAIKLFIEARDEAQKTQIAAGGTSTQRWLMQRITDELGILDPNAVPKEPPGGELPPELQEKLKALQEGKLPGVTP
jgi:hypothetical protein